MIWVIIILVGIIVALRSEGKLWIILCAGAIVAAGVVGAVYTSHVGI